MENGVGEQIHAEIRVARDDDGGGEGGVVAGFGGNLSSDEIDGLRELLSGARLRPLREHAGGHGSDAGHVFGIVDCSGGHQNQTNRDNWQAMVGDDEDAKAIGKLARIGMRK